MSLSSGMSALSFLDQLDSQVLDIVEEISQQLHQWASLEMVVCVLLERYNIQHFEQLNVGPIESVPCLKQLQDLHRKLNCFVDTYSAVSNSNTHTCILTYKDCEREANLFLQSFCMPTMLALRKRIKIADKKNSIKERDLESSECLSSRPKEEKERGEDENRCEPDADPDEIDIDMDDAEANEESAAAVKARGSESESNSSLKVTATEVTPTDRAHTLSHSHNSEQQLLKEEEEEDEEEVEEGEEEGESRTTSMQDYGLGPFNLHPKVLALFPFPLSNPLQQGAHLHGSAQVNPTPTPTSTSGLPSACEVVELLLDFHIHAHTHSHTGVTKTHTGAYQGSAGLVGAEEVENLVRFSFEHAYYYLQGRLGVDNLLHVGVLLRPISGPISGLERAGSGRVLVLGMEEASAFRHVQNVRRRNWQALESKQLREGE